MALLDFCPECGDDLYDDGEFVSCENLDCVEFGEQYYIEDFEESYDVEDDPEGY